MHKRFGICVAVCLLALANASFAQTDSPETFPVEQRCIAAPIQPPDDWTYPGMILMSGYAGIHAMQADWETPRVVAFLSQDNEGNIPLDGGQLSPDQNWYALPMGERYTEVSGNIYYFIRTLRIYSMSGSGETLNFDLPEYRDIAIFSAGARTYFPVQWRDNDSLIIGGLLLYPFTGNGETIGFDLVAFDWESPPIFSPDLTRAYGNGVFFNGSLYSGLYDPFNPEEFQKKSLSALEGVYWRHDSSGFMAYLPSGRGGLAYYNRDGELQARVLELDEISNSFSRPISGRTDLRWSSTGNYFAFAAFSSTPSLDKLYLVDWQNRLVIDTCLTPSTAAVWSPDGTMFAYLASAQENRSLIVVDTQIWQAYIVAYHSGGQMVGWRDTTNDQ